MFSWKKLPERLVVIAHRGASQTAPENTLASFRQAMEAGADAIELDVRLTSDNEVVVIHDSRLERTTDGRGEIGKSSLSKIKTFSAGSWFHKKYASESIPHLREVFELVKGRVGINIEFKQKGLRPQRQLLEETLRIIHEYNAGEYVLLSSFHHSLISLVRTYDKTVSTGLLFSPLTKFSRSRIRRLNVSDALFYLTSKRSIRKKTIENLHLMGYKTGIYTVNNEREVRKMLRYGVDCVFTDDPATIRGISTKIPHLGD